MNNVTFVEHMCRTADALLEANVDERQVYEVLGKFWDLRRSEIQEIILIVNETRQQRKEDGVEL